MHCGLGVPSLRSLWGAVRNRQLYILLMYCKSCISFNFSIVFYNLHGLPPKKIACVDRKKEIQFFCNLHKLPQRKITRIYRKNLQNLIHKKIHDSTIFFCLRVTFFTPLSADITTATFLKCHLIGGFGTRHFSLHTIIRSLPLEEGELPLEEEAKSCRALRRALESLGQSEFKSPADVDIVLYEDIIGGNVAGDEVMLAVLAYRIERKALFGTASELLMAHETRLHEKWLVQQGHKDSKDEVVEAEGGSSQAAA